MVGRYSALLIQVKDSRDWSEPVDVALVQKLGSAALVKLIPAWEPQVKPGNLDIDTKTNAYDANAEEADFSSDFGQIANQWS